MDGTYTMTGNYHLPALYLPAEKERHMGAETCKVFEAKQQGFVYEPYYKRQAERISCKCRRTGRGYVFSAGSGICRQAERDRTVEIRKSILMDSNLSNDSL